MITSFQHKGLEAFFRRGTKAGIQAHHAAKLRTEVQSQVETALEETGFWSNTRRDAKAPSLGVLDTLDDLGAMSTHELASISAAIPMNPEEAREHGAATHMSLVQEQLDTKTRLVQLSSLLADPKLRKALEGLR